MGFDNESILNPETVPGEYCCPLCRQLVYPTEAQQTPCGHLFCRECVVYILGTTRCCPYDNRPINEPDPKALMQANVMLFESLCRIPVRCVFHKSGCAWQGQLADAMTHSTNCSYGSSPVFCNKCGLQIMHRQIPEHVVSCPGTAAQSKGPQQMPTNSQLGPQHVLGPGQVGPGSHQVQQAIPGGQQTQLAAYQAGHYVNGQEQPRPQSTVVGQWNSQEQHYQLTHEQYQQYQQHEQPQQIQQIQQSRQQIRLSSAQKPYNVQEPIQQQYQQQEGHPHPYLQSQQSMLQPSQPQLSHERLPMQPQHLHEQNFQSQNILPMQPQQQAAAPWEQQMQRKQIEQVRDGNLQIAHGAEQLQLHDRNASQHAGLLASMQQPSRSNIQPWQGHPMATASDVRDPQSTQSFHNNQGHPGSSNQLLQEASLHPAMNQPGHMPAEQAALLSAQNNELARARHFSPPQIESGYLSGPPIHPAQRGIIQEKVAYGQQMNLHHHRGDQAWPDTKEGPLYGHPDAYQAARRPPSAADDRHPSVTEKQQHQVEDARLTVPFPQIQGREIPLKDVPASGIGEEEEKQPLMPKKNLNSVRQGIDSPSPLLSARIHDSEEAENGGDWRTSKMHTHLSNEHFSSEPTKHGSMKSYDRTDAFPPQLRTQSYHDASRPLQPEVDRMSHLRRMINDYGKTPVEDGHLHQQPPRDGFLDTHQAERRPEMPHGYASETSYLTPSLSVPPMEASSQLAFMEASRQAGIGASRGPPIESRRPILDMPIKENDRRPHDQDKSLLYKAGNLDAREILQLSSLSNFHPKSPERERASGDFISRYPADSQSLGMRSSIFQFSGEIDKEPGAPREIGAERFLDIALRKGQPMESGQWSTLPVDLELRPRNNVEFGADANKLYPDGPSRYGLPADMGMRIGTADRDAPFASLPDIGRRPGFPFDVESRPKIPLEMEHRPFDPEARTRFPGDSGFRPGIDLDLEHRLYGLPLDARRHPGIPLDVDGRPILSDTLRDVMGRTPEGFSGLRSDITLPASQIHSRGPEPGFSVRSPGRGLMDLPIRRESGYRLGLPPQFEDLAPRLPLHPGMEVNRDPLHEDPRLNIHRHSLLDDPERLLHVGGRNFPFGAPRPGVEILPGNRPGPHAFIDEGPAHKMTDNLEMRDMGRKRPQTGSSGWCRICLVDCFSVEGLREHSQSEEHHRKTLELVDSIKRDHTKRQKNSKDESRSEPAEDSKSEHEDDSRSEPADDSRSEAEENNEKSNSSSSSPSSSKSE